MQRLYINQNQLYYAFEGEGFITPIQTFLPWMAFTTNITPTKMKKNGPKNPSNATNLVP